MYNVSLQYVPKLVKLGHTGEELYFSFWRKSFSYQDTLPLHSFLVCILIFDNKTSNHIWMTIWPFFCPWTKKKKTTLDWTTDVNSNSYWNSSIYSEAIWITHFCKAQGLSLFHAGVWKASSWRGKGCYTLQFSSKFKGNLETNCLLDKNWRKLLQPSVYKKSILKIWGESTFLDTSTAQLCS